MTQQNPLLSTTQKETFLPRLQLMQSTKLQQIFIAGPLASIQFKFEAKILIGSVKKCQISTPLSSGPVSQM